MKEQDSVTSNAALEVSSFALGSSFRSFLVRSGGQGQSAVRSEITINLHEVAARTPAKQLSVWITNDDSNDSQVSDTFSIIGKERQHRRHRHERHEHMTDIAPVRQDC